MATAPARHAKNRAGATQLVLIPSYDSGAKLLQTVGDALRHWPDVWVVIDGSTDGSGDTLAVLERRDCGLRVIRRGRNGGKGQAVLDGLRAAAAAGFTHVLVMDGDGQHPASLIAEFFAWSRAHPRAMILGLPVFDRSAPCIRVIGRRVSNVLARVQSWGCGPIGDSLFGFRVYPLADLLTIMQESRHMRGFDFDAEAVVRLAWRGVPAINLPAPVRYFAAGNGGVSHFRYGRDNMVLAAMHLRLVAGFLARLFRSSRH